MKKALTSILLIGLINLLCLLSVLGQNENISFENKSSLTVVITDSGLGGLDVMDDISKKIKLSGHYKNVNLIFVNALFEAGKGYNSLQSREEKIEVFNDVLWGIEKNFKPDIILIACNTLSVIYNDTEFISTSNTPVVGIVKSGVDMILSCLEQNPSASVLITGTETTITENTHAKLLLNAGISKNRIYTQACPQLQSYIEQNPTGDDTGMLISVYIDEASAKMPDADATPVYLSLNCTHFGYSEALWKEAFSYADMKFAGILNPNDIMGDLLMPESGKGKYKKTKISYKIFSKVEILNKASIVNIFKTSSPELANALNNYDIVSDLF